MLRFSWVVLLVSIPWLNAQETVQILDTDGRYIEGPTSLTSVTVVTESGTRTIPIERILSIHSGRPASAREAARIDAGIKAIQALTKEPIGSDVRKNCDAAVEELTAIGLPVMTPLLRALKDTDHHEPRPLYRLFERIMPSEADQLNRTASLLRLSSREMIRGELQGGELKVGETRVDWSRIRRLAVLRDTIRRYIDLHSLRHSTQVEYMDTGIVLTKMSTLRGQARGFVRLSWDVDGWATDADGLKVPGPNYKSNLVDGFPFGAVVGRVGAGGDVFLFGKSFYQRMMPAGLLQLGVNDNRHWQNNVGTFHLRITVTQAYDVGSPQ